MRMEPRGLAFVPAAHIWKVAKNLVASLSPYVLPKKRLKRGMRIALMAIREILIVRAVFLMIRNVARPLTGVTIGVSHLTLRLSSMVTIHIQIGPLTIISSPLSFHRGKVA